MYIHPGYCNYCNKLYDCDQIKQTNGAFKMGEWINKHWESSSIQPVSQLRTIAEVERFMDMISRHEPGLRGRAASKDWSPEELAGDPRLKQMCDALQRIAVLRSPTCGVQLGGDILHHRV